MAICIKGHYSTRDEKDKAARLNQVIKDEWRAYSSDLAKGVIHKKPNQLITIKELHGKGMADRVK